MFGLLISAASKVLFVSLIIGAGLPALFALGVKSLAHGTGPDGTAIAPNPAGKVVAAAIFSLVLFTIGIGIAIVVASGLGQSVSFEHIYPTFVPKHK
ncbi:hypothetical protein SAMN05421595_0438 [Austwickia chelonae]|uniref:Uncharacterized protein n=1 Tax=Austwickia chelonae NBRC 105200 TaxID=1184607 RepID=K6W7V9_9MICO|nr:hypothetical protein [Austwickia chelonae]GAB77927.1 hypothetical protein AUCHE_08_01700 [Austwickia chelonae NBRC 105200]SEV92416.1 hypothetical protein SAMN05421595_0438 [Austwickia chelonae]